MNDQPDDQPDDRPDARPDEDVVGQSRRTFFSRTAMAAAAAAVTGVAIAHDAQAANGDTMFVGSNNTATSTTTISGGGSLVVQAGTSGDAAIVGIGGIGGTYDDGVKGLSGSESGAGVYGLNTHNGGSGVWGRNEAVVGGKGVYGQNEANQGLAVFGVNNGELGIGVYGYHSNGLNSGSGVVGISNQGVGVAGSGTTVDLHAAGSGKVLLDSATVGPTTTGDRGTIARDASGNFWTAVADDTWRKVSGPGTAGALHLLASPTRVYDSRVGKTPTVGTKAPLTSGSRSIDCTANSSGVPATARGVIVNVTVLWSSASGYVAITPGGAGDTGTSNANSPGIGGKTASLAIVACGTGARAGKIDVSVGPGGSFDFIVDVTGYFL